MERALVDDRAARGVDQVGARLHQREPARVDQAAGRFVQRAVDGQEVGFAKQRVEVDQADADLGRDLRIGDRVVRDAVHLERAGQAEQLGADVAEADRAQRAAGQAGADVVELLAPAAAAGERSLISTFCASISTKVSAEVATGRRTPSGAIVSSTPAAVQAGTSIVS
jgi:hypothetical protein